MTHISTSVSAAEQAARAFAARSHGAFIDGAFEAAAGEPLAVENPRGSGSKPSGRARSTVGRRVGRSSAALRD